MPPKKNEQQDLSQSPEQGQEQGNNGAALTADQIAAIKAEAKAEALKEAEAEKLAALDGLKKQADEAIQKLAEQNELLNKELEEAKNTASNVPVPLVQDEGEMIGNKDEEGKFPFPANWKHHVVVHQCQIQALGGGVVEVPNTHTLQTYAPDVFDRMNNSDGKQKNSFFSESKMKVVVLHDPRG